ncbi:hypothetical protein BIW11_07053 [Tropilaelaps mercedesae]|jgi:hypothetical protein
MTRD